MSNLKEAITNALINGKLPCAHAFALAKKIGVEPIDVGRVATEEKIKISRCQLGLFGYPGEERPVERMKAQVTDELRKAVESLSIDGQLPCATAWQIASELKVAKMLVSAAAEELKVRIRACQLGCFK